MIKETEAVRRLKFRCPESRCIASMRIRSGENPAGFYCLLLSLFLFPAQVVFAQCSGYDKEND